jgi:hypothetical protein
MVDLPMDSEDVHSVSGVDTAPATTLGTTVLAPRVLEGIDLARFTAGHRQIGDEFESAAYDRLSLLAAERVNTVIDLTPIGYERAAGIVRTAARSAGINVMFATGIDLNVAPASIRAQRPVQLADLLIAELQDEVPGAGMPASVIGVVAPDDPSVWEKLLLTTAFAHAETGAPVILSTTPGRAPLESGQLVGRGVDPERIAVFGFGRADTTIADIDATAREGVHLVFGGVSGGGLGHAALSAYAIREYGAHRVALAVDCAAGPGSVSGFVADLATFGTTPDLIAAVLGLSVTNLVTR